MSRSARWTAPSKPNFAQVSFHKYFLVRKSWKRNLLSSLSQSCETFPTISGQDVTGYPTLKFFKDGAENGVKYRGARDEAALTKFINQQMGVEVEVGIT